MKKEVDMNYTFTSENEPTDEQLERLMECAIEQVLIDKEKLKGIMSENLRREYEIAKKKFPHLAK
jgi:hypothetical protein